jgi:CubicO group peptidase (beta-lactamase class C family)
VKVNRRIVVGGIGVGLLAGEGATCAAEPLSEDIREQVRQLMDECDVPGLGFGLVREGRVVSVEAFGFSNREQETPVTSDTVFLISSISKVVTGTAMMQLQERGLFRLDDPIARHLDFVVANPRHSGDITFRHLFMHTSSIYDRNYGPSFAVDGDSPITLRDFLFGYLSPNGRWFSSNGSFTDFAPGERFSYSNVGIALAAYLGERLSGRSLKLETARHIFQPLHMSPAAWSLADLGSVPLATPYVVVDGRLSPGSQIGYPDWPSGLLRTTPTALTRFIAAHAGRGRLGAARILQRNTVREMVDIKAIPGIDFPTQNQGLFWEGMRGEGLPLVSKGGSDPGAHSLVGFNPETGNGAIVLTNRDPSGPLQRGMERLIRQAAA